MCCVGAEQGYITTVCVCVGGGFFFRDQLTFKNRQKSLFALRQTLLSFNRDSEGFVTLRQRLLRLL